MFFLKKVDAFIQSEPNISLLPIVAFVFGILTYFNLSAEPDFLLISILTVCSAGFLFFKTSKEKKILMFLPFFFFAGLLICLLHSAVIQTHFIAQPLTHVTVSGKVISVENRLNSTKIDLKVYDITRQDLTLQIEKSVLPIQKLPKIVRLYTNENEINEGDYITGEVTALTPPHMPLTEFGTNEARTLWFEGIEAVGSLSRIRVIDTHKNANLSKFKLFSQAVQHRFLKNLSEENRGVALALVLGSTQYITTSSRLLYRDLGLSHILSVSGFHIGLIAFFIFVIIRFCFNLFFPRLSGILIKRIALVAAAILCFFYVLLSGAHAPAVRSYLMVCAVLTALFFDKRTISLRNLFFAAFLILCFKPVLLTDVSFQLSFIAVLCITGVCTHFQKLFKEKLFHQKTLTVLSGLLLFNLWVTVSTIPFVLYTFHQISVFSIIGNLLLSSLFAFAIIPLLFLSIITFLIEPFSILCLSGADILLSFIYTVGLPVSSWTNTSIYVPYFHAFGLVFWTIGLIGFSLFQSNIRYCFCLFLLLFLTSFLFVEKPVAFIGAGGRFVGYRNKNTYYETESYYFNQLHRDWLTYAGLNPEKNRILPLLPQNSPLIGLNAQYCQGTFLSIYQNETMIHCPHLISPEEIYAWQTISVYADRKNSRTYHIRKACETDKFRPWRIACPEKINFYTF